MNLLPIFSHFISFDYLDMDLVGLETLIKNIEKSDIDSRKLSNVGGWQSNELDFFCGELSPLRSVIESRTDTVRQVLGIKKNLEILNMWANINRYRDYNNYHVHSKSIISGVFYIRCAKNSGNIVFENPDRTLRYYLDSSLDLEYNHFNSHNWSVEPEENKLLLFPSWLSHSVSANLSQEDRISISFNFGIK